uniref:Chemosensory protein n=1 Tax=Cnaphalocrocis medinalis TaxID=437488 RepID=A0A0A1CP63_CNAME|nr:chemosensory protein [Cnaphalocrocis medinalis]
MRSTILLTILAIVALSLAEDTDQAKDTKSKESGKESDKESGNESGKESGKEETYTDRFDNINVDEIVANRRLLVPYLKCALDKGRCTPEGKELKIHIQDAMQTACKKCTEKQKTGARQVVNHIKEKEPLYWEELLAKYDPKNELKPIYEPFLAGKDK